MYTCRLSKECRTHTRCGGGCCFREDSVAYISIVRAHGCNEHPLAILASFTQNVLLNKYEEHDGKKILMLVVEDSV